MLAPSSRPARCSRSGSRAVMITSAPSARARRAVSSPIPALPPITRTVCPSSSGSRDSAVSVAHVGSSVPPCSATMYSAYQSGQFASASPIRCLVLAVGGRRPPHRARQIRCRHVRRLAGIDPAWQPDGDLLEQPRVAVRIGERGVRQVAPVLGVGAARSVRAGLNGEPWNTSLTSTPRRDELVARRLDVGDDQLQALGRAGRGRRHALAERDRAARAGRRELDDAEGVADGEVGVGPPAEAS